MGGSAFDRGVRAVYRDKMADRLAADGFIAALDQSGGSTPGALRLYGIPDDAYAGDAEMFALIHAMRVRIMTSPAFTGAKVLGAILFEGTMDGSAAGKPVPAFLWEERGIVPFLKVDKGFGPKDDGVSLMKPMPDLDALLERAIRLGVYGTKMRSVINMPSERGIAAVVEQQFAIADQIASHGLMPIIEPEVSIKSPDKRGAEALLLAELAKRLDDLPEGRQVMLKLTLPDVTDLYAPLTRHPRVARVVALSGGYSREEACAKLACNHGVIASFSRALTEGLTAGMSDDAFDATLVEAIDEIYRASVDKHQR
jgi:fructose-bisphosphate aldolase class I